MSSKTEAILGKKFIGAIRSIGIQEPEELLLYAPSKFIDLAQTPRLLPEALAASREGEKSVVRLQLLSNPELFDKQGNPINSDQARYASGTQRLKIRYTDGTHQGMTNVFGRAVGGNLDAWLALSRHEVVTVYTSVSDEWNGVLGLVSPELMPTSALGKVLTRYTGKERIVNPLRIAEKITALLAEGGIPEAKAYLLNKLGISEAQFARVPGLKITDFEALVMALHKPKNMQELNLAQESIGVLNALYAYVQSTRYLKKTSVPESAITISPKADMAPLVKALPFEPTRDQKMAILETIEDLGKDKPMRRLLSGDVGTGKTICYLLPCIAAHQQGKKVAIMSPNSLLSNQIADELESLAPSIPVARIQGGAKDLPDNWDDQIIVGTTAILFWYEKLAVKPEVDFFVLDEQQKLGKAQKEKLIGNKTNFLEATATAIPRTMGLIKYAGMEVSRIQQCPVEKHITSVIAGPQDKGGIVQEMREALAQGGQVAVLYNQRGRSFSQFILGLPEGSDLALAQEAFEEACEDVEDAFFEVRAQNQDGSVECVFEGRKSRLKALRSAFKDRGIDSSVLEENPPESTESDKKNVEEAFTAFQRVFGGGVAMLHGQTPKDEQRQILADMKAGKINLLITSTVIEIGITLPSLNYMMVVGAESMGASTLHQIRGRLVRHGGKGTFVMMTKKPIDELKEESAARLMNVRDNTNGYAIAEEDMLQRGFGDIGKLGSKQSGIGRSLFPNTATCPAQLEFMSKTIENLKQSPQGSSNNGP